MGSRAAGMCADREFVNPHGVAAFDDLGVGQPGVRHMRVHGIGTIGVRRCATAAANGFVISESVVAEGEVVHRSLAGRRDFQRAQQHIDDALRRFHVAANDRRALSGQANHIAKHDIGGFYKIVLRCL